MKLGARTAKPIRIGSENGNRFRVGRYQPLLSEPYANCHAVALRPGQDTLDVAHRWEHTGEYDLSAVPWGDILEKKVRYSLSSMYGGPRQQKPPIADAVCAPDLIPLPRPTSPAALPPRCRSLSSGAKLVGQGNSLRLVGADRSPLWILELPAGHELIDFASWDGLLLLATRSNQGARDGELLIPYLTTHVFAVRNPPLN